MNAVWCKWKARAQHGDLNSQNCSLQGPSSLAQRSGRILPAMIFVWEWEEAPYYAQGLRNLVCVSKGTSAVRAEIWIRISRAATYITLQHRGEQQHLTTLQSNVVQGLMLLWTIESFHASGMCKVWCSWHKSPSLGLVERYVHCLMLLTPRVLPCVCYVPMSRCSLDHQSPSHPSPPLMCKVCLLLIKDLLRADCVQVS
jgi:hypothetical protein